jgi:hypothetical protein
MSDSGATESQPQRPRLNLKPRDPNAAKQLEIQRTASGKVGWPTAVAFATRMCCCPVRYLAGSSSLGPCM